MTTRQDEIVSDFTETLPQYSELRYVVRTFFKRRLAIIGLVIILILAIVAIFAPLLAPYDPLAVNLDDRLEQPSWEYPLGTDATGRDTLSRIIYGTRTSLAVAFGAMAIAASVGITIGMLAGFFGGIVHIIIMRLVDAVMSIPMLILALCLAALLGGGIKNVILALGITLTSIYARLMCAQVLIIKENDYVMAERSMGATNLRIMLYHLMPNAFPPLIVMVTLQLGTMILAEAGLSFIGVGIQPPTPAWGAMVNSGYPYLFTHPILSIAPGMAIALVVFGFNMAGDGLRDALDPKLRGII
jgi:peptide/nickel transport system permease protein